jgi:CopA family copper-resistance protein
LRASAGAALLGGLDHLLPAYARARIIAAAPPPTRGNHRDIELRIQRQTVAIGGKDGSVTSINGVLPGPLVRMREDELVTLRVTNELDEDSSIHWHGLLVPAEMDGVPGVSFPGIRPGETFTYQYLVKQSGTYWYHSHSGLQEQSGVYGPLIIDPREPEPFRYDRDYVVLLSDWTFRDPYAVLHDLRTRPGYFNFQRQTLLDLPDEISEKGWRAALSDRLMWSHERMDPTDFADVTGEVYTYLMNGLPAAANWTALFARGERVRLRFINGSAMSYFDVRIPGLAMTVVQADGQNVAPIRVEEFRIAVAETYDVIVEPRDDRAYTIFAESLDRSGYARGTLAPRAGLEAALPERRPRPLRTMADMGMEMSEAGGDEMEGMEGMEMPDESKPAPSHAGHGDPGQGSPPPAPAHGPDRHGRGNSMVAEVPRSRLHEPGDGLEATGTRVLVYTDLRSLEPGEDQRAPSREIELHLTGNMERYMWSFDGVAYSEGMPPTPLSLGERVRLVLVNDTMMEHPIHLHGMWMVLENGAGDYLPRKHTLNVKPAERLTCLVSVDAPGRWAFHCHLLFHMDMGMFRVVSVT